MRSTTLGFRQGLLLLALGGVCLGAQSSPCKHSGLAQRNHTTFLSSCRDMTCIDAMQFEFMQLDESQHLYRIPSLFPGQVDLLIQGEFGWDPEEFHYALQQWAGPFSTNWYKSLAF